MKINKHTLIQLIEKFQDGKASNSEIEILVQFFNSNQQSNKWPEEIPDKEKFLAQLFAKIEKSFEKKATSRQRILRMIPKFYRYAAAVVMFVAVTYFFTKDNFIKQAPIVVDNSIPIGTDKATLTLEDGSKVALEKGENYRSEQANSNGIELIYVGSNESNSKSITFNYLTIPRGGEFFIQLTDDTKVWLNSESKIKYPVNFIKGKAREVELIYGEAYFDVSPSTKHNGSSFKVISQGQTIEVLGTEFNVKAYQGDLTVSTTLVEGKVEVEMENQKELLKPSEQLAYNTLDGTHDIREVDVNVEIAWRKGQFIFKGESLSEVAKVLARWYNADIKFASEEFVDMKINGVLRKDQNIEFILITLKNIKNIEYEINGNSITIK